MSPVHKINIESKQLEQVEEHPRPAGSNDSSYQSSSHSQGILIVMKCATHLNFDYENDQFKNLSLPNLINQILQNL